MKRSGQPDRRCGQRRNRAGLYGEHALLGLPDHGVSGVVVRAPFPDQYHLLGAGAGSRHEIGFAVQGAQRRSAAVAGAVHGCQGAHAYPAPRVVEHRRASVAARHVGVAANGPWPGAKIGGVGFKKSLAPVHQRLGGGKGLFLTGVITRHALFLHAHLGGKECDEGGRDQQHDGHHQRGHTALASIGRKALVVHGRCSGRVKGRHRFGCRFFPEFAGKRHRPCCSRPQRVRCQQHFSWGHSRGCWCRRAD